MGFDASVKLTKANFNDLPPLCTDGAWGTEMQKLGARPGQMCDVWNVEQPDKVFSVAKGYVDAGSQVILTNTFNSNRIVLAKHNMAARAAEFSREGAAISKKAASGKAYVFASIGPCGKIVMMGEIDPAEVEEAAAEQAKAFAEGGADAIVIETQSDLVEAEAAIKGVLRAVDLPVGLSFTFDSGANNDFTMMGASIPQVCDLAKQYGASFVGANCGAGIETFVNIAQEFAACGTGIPVWVKGNAGKPELDDSGRTVYRAKPEVYSAVVNDLLGAGAKFIGGCCGSSPDHIRAVAQAMAAQ
ncbi:MAG TPA: homocysteine S-methyltransferase family protein [Candidatus Hydrogenedentes bacterium]|nr:homocysteine S-methyltransferase family protein [Candidatus Hydrogenedentota bacterium]HOS03190.1 homocysteine S-methyltransferase family protein [Candidatus Hydrogenedentota bacterium]